MIESTHAAVKLSNGIEMPLLGLGVWRSGPGAETEQAVRWALDAGYRHIDTAAIYQNEESVGKGVAESDVPRDEVFVTTKVWNTDQGYDTTLRAMETSLKKLGLEYVDLYLVHWPVKGKFKDTWRAMEVIYESGKAKAIGVSNFLVHHLEDLLGSAKVAPMVNQVEFHPRLQQPELLAFDQKHGIAHEAWAPIMKGRVNDIPELQAIAKQHGKSPVQVTIRWELQKGVVTIPKSVHQERIVNNADVFDFELTADELATIDGLDAGERVGPHPDEIDF
ncbi:MAG: aldo/keto reductase [Candidatus Hydrogenedentes bacterium]|nr:aldo/keto reductase [Candidatus Hydrogenedentota bacterium]